MVPGIRPLWHKKPKCFPLLKPLFSGLWLNLGWIFLSVACFFIVYITHSSSKGEQTVKVEFLARGSPWQGKEVKYDQLRWKPYLIEKKRLSRGGGVYPTFNPFDLLHFLDFCKSTKDQQLVHSVRVREWGWCSKLQHKLRIPLTPIKPPRLWNGSSGTCRPRTWISSQEARAAFPNTTAACVHPTKKSSSDSGWIPRGLLVMSAFVSWCVIRLSYGPTGLLILQDHM